METWKEKEYRAFLKGGVIAATVANVNRDPKSHPEAFTAEDFAPRRAPKYMSLEEGEQAMRQWAARYGVAPKKMEPKHG